MADATIFILTVPGYGLEGWSIKTRVRINDMIKVTQVRLISAEGEQLGIKETAEAQAIADEADLDLVEVAPQGDPPVCKVMDYGKYKYQQTQKMKAARKKQSIIVVKEIKMRPKIGDHDYETKKRHVERFIKHGDKVKVTIMFRGREMTHTDLGRKILDRLVSEMEGVAEVESMPKLDGRNMVMVLTPVHSGSHEEE